MTAEALAGHVAVMAEAREPIPDPSSPDAPFPEWLADAPGRTIATVLVPVELPGRTVRVNITLNEGLRARLDKATGAAGETCSGYIAQAVRERLGR